MKKFALILALFLIAAPARADSQFVNGFDDLPLMPGMAELSGELMTFDSPTGRIVENTVRGDVAAQVVLDFYASSLPQLGWTRTDARHFRREDEILKLEFKNPDGASVTLHFRLYPADK